MFTVRICAQTDTRFMIHFVQFVLSELLYLITVCGMFFLNKTSLLHLCPLLFFTHFSNDNSQFSTHTTHRQKSTCTKCIRRYYFQPFNQFFRRFDNVTAFFRQYQSVFPSNIRQCGWECFVFARILLTLYRTQVIAFNTYRVLWSSYTIILLSKDSNYK